MFYLFTYLYVMPFLSHFWAHSPLSRVVIVVVVVVDVVDIDAQAARDSTASDTWWMGLRQLTVANGPNIFQMLLVCESSIHRQAHHVIHWPCISGHMADSCRNGDRHIATCGSGRIYILLLHHQQNSICKIAISKSTPNLKWYLQFQLGPGNECVR